MSTKSSETITVVAEPTANSTMPTVNLNIKGLKTLPVLLKFLETIIGSICLYIGFNTQMDVEFIHAFNMQLIFIVVFLVPTSLLLISSLVSSMSANMIPKTIFEFLYHLSASVLYVVFSILLTVHVFVDDVPYAEGITLSVLCILNAVLYCISTFHSYRSYRSS